MVSLKSPAQIDSSIRECFSPGVLAARLVLTALQARWFSSWLRYAVYYRAFFRTADTQILTSSFASWEILTSFSCANLLLATARPTDRVLRRFDWDTIRRKRRGGFPRLLYFLARYLLLAAFALEMRLTSLGFGVERFDCRVGLFVFECVLPMADVAQVWNYAFQGVAYLSMVFSSAVFLMILYASIVACVNCPHLAPGSRYQPNADTSLS